MTEIESFLDKDTCVYLINLFKKKENGFIFNKRVVKNLKHFEKDPVINKLILKYKNLRPLETLKNFELIWWPVGECHPWHMDNGYKDDSYNYDTTSITFLNEGYEGGRTSIKNDLIIGDYTIEPRTGKHIIFSSWIPHKASTLLSGKRYVLIAWYKKYNNL